VPTPQILIVEDDPLLAEALIEFLEENDLSVIHTDDGAKAYSLYKAHSPAIILLDIQLPNKNGFEVIEEIRQEDVDTPILLMTGTEYEEDKEIMGYKLGAINYIKKPVALPVLMAQIASTLKWSIHKPKVYNVNGCKIEFLDQKVSINDGAQLILREKDVLVLSLLLETNDQIITRKNILKRAWKDDDYINHNSLNNVISRLRKLLSPYSIQIKSVYGNGLLLKW